MLQRTMLGKEEGWDETNEDKVLTETLVAAISTKAEYSPSAGKWEDRSVKHQTVTFQNHEH